MESSLKIVDLYFKAFEPISNEIMVVHASAKDFVKESCNITKARKKLETDMAP